MAGLETFIAQWTSPLWQSGGAFLLIFSAFFGTGKLLLRRFPKENFAAFALGTLVFMALTALLPPSRILLLSVTLPPGLWGMWKSLELIRKMPLLSLLTVGLFLFFLGSALLIPYSWDEQTYQLALPLRYLQSGGKWFCPDNPYSFYPPLTGRFFANAIALGGIGLPRLIVGAVTPLLLAGTVKLAAPYGKLPACAAGAALILSPLFLSMNRAVYVENFIALFTLGGFFAFRGMRKHFPYAPVVCGLLAGGAFAVKPTGAVGALFLFILFLFPLKAWKKTLIFLLCAFGASFFWYLPTFLETGNFFYPYALFPAPGSVEEFHRILGSARYGLEGATGALLNWLFAGFDRKLFDGIVTGFQMPFLGVAAAAGLYLWSRNHPRFRTFSLLTGGAILLPLLLWSILFPQSRFLLPLLPLVTAGGVIAIERSKYRKWFYTFLVLLLGVVFFFQSFVQLRHYLISWRILPHVRKTPGAALGTLARDPGLYKTFAFLAEKTPPHARCLLLMERRGLYCPRPWTIACPGFEPTLTPVPESSGKLFEKLRTSDYIIVGITTQDVDLQSANTEACQKVFSLLNELIEKGKLKMIFANESYPVLQVIK